MQTRDFPPTFSVKGPSIVIYNEDINSAYLLSTIYSPDSSDPPSMSDDDHYWSTRVHGQIYDRSGYPSVPSPSRVICSDTFI